jgi:hypothetical protein
MQNRKKTKQVFQEKIFADCRREKNIIFGVEEG